MARKEEERLGWPDKGAAVGVGAGDWNNRIISAVSQIDLLALLAKYVMISMSNAPSAGKFPAAAAFPQ